MRTLTRHAEFVFLSHRKNLVKNTQKSLSVSLLGEWSDSVKLKLSTSFSFSRWVFSLFLHTAHRRDERRLSPHMHITVVASQRREPTHQDDDGGKESSSSSSWRKWEKITRLWRVCGCLARGKFEDIVRLKLSHSLRCSLTDRMNYLICLPTQPSWRWWSSSFPFSSQQN